MGTTLASYHVYGQAPEAVQPLLEAGFSVRMLSPGWTTVLCDDRELSDVPAKKLSKALGAPVLSFLYFDDDLIWLTTFAGGRLAAQYRMDYGAEPYSKNVGAFAEALGWDKALAPRLKRIFDCHELEEKTAMLEEFFGVALRVDARMLEDGAEGFARMRGDALYREYEARQKKISTINNRMRAVLTQELDAKLSGAWPCIAVRRAEDADTYDSDMGEVLELSGDELRPMLGSFRMRSFNPKIYPGRGWLTIADVMGDPLRVSRDGRVLGSVPLPEGVEVTTVLEDGDIIGVAHHGRVEGSSVMRLNAQGEEVWHVTLNGMFFRVSPVMHGSNIYCGAGSIENDDGLFMKLDEDGRTLASLQTPYLNSHTEVLFHDGWIYYLGDQRSDTSCREVLLKLDESLRIVGTAEAPKGVPIYGDAFFDRRHGRLYYNALDKRIVRFDIAAMRCDVFTTDEEIYLSLAGEDGYLYGFSGSSTLWVLDADAKPVSRHRLKGGIFDVRESETGVHALTATGDMAAWGFSEPPCWLRVYRVEPV